MGCANHTAHSFCINQGIYSDRNQAEISGQFIAPKYTAPIKTRTPKKTRNELTRSVESANMNLKNVMAKPTAASKTIAHNRTGWM